MGKFAASVDKWTRQTKDRMDAVVREALQDVIEEAQTPVAKGGRMRVDTSFLRNSGQASLTGMPSGPATLDEGMPSPNADLIIAQTKAGDTLFFGWTANYAKWREYEDAFLLTAIQKWPQIVRRAIRKIKAGQA